MRFLGSTKIKVTKNENGKNFPHLEITEVALVHYNIVNNDHQSDSKVLYAFVPNNTFRQLLGNSPKKICFQGLFFQSILGYGSLVTILSR